MVAEGITLVISLCFAQGDNENITAKHMESDIYKQAMKAYIEYF